MVGTAIGRHPQVAMHGELFGGGIYPLGFYGIDNNLAWPTPLEIELMKIRDANLTEFFDRWVFARTARNAVGFKFKFEEFSLWPGVIDYINKENLKVILLRRRNLLNRYLSEVESLAAGLFNSTDTTSFGISDNAAIRTKLKTSAVRANIEMTLENEREFRKVFGQNPVLDVTYEAVLNAWPDTSREICEFLEIVPIELTPETNPQPRPRKIDPYFDRAALIKYLAKKGLGSCAF